MTCNGICHRYKVTKGKRTDSWYRQGAKRSYQFFTDLLGSWDEYQLSENDRVARSPAGGAALNSCGFLCLRKQLISRSFVVAKGAALKHASAPSSGSRAPLLASRRG